jgi:hypothetical protein
MEGTVTWIDYSRQGIDQQLAGGGNYGNVAAIEPAGDCTQGGGFQRQKVGRPDKLPIGRL